MNTEYTYLSAAETAKLIRVQLKKHFPNTKFYVNSETYSGGASINIDWYDGPTNDQVKAITNPFSGAGFDGMTDYKTSHNAWLLPDGSAVFAKYENDYFTTTHTTQPHPDAKLIHFGADYIFENRHYTTAVRPIIEKVCEEHNTPAPTFYERHPFIGKKQRMEITTLDWDSRDFDYWMNDAVRTALNFDMSNNPEPAKTQTDAEKIETQDVRITWDRTWTWITFPAKPSDATREILKSELGARWSPKRNAWYICNTMEESEIRMRIEH